MGQVRPVNNSDISSPPAINLVRGLWLSALLFFSTLAFQGFALAADRQVDASSCSPSVSLSVTPPSEVTTWALEESIG